MAVDPPVEAKAAPGDGRSYALEQAAVACLDHGLIVLAKAPEHRKLGIVAVQQLCQRGGKNIVPTPIRGHQNRALLEEPLQRGFQL